MTQCQCTIATSSILFYNLGLILLLIIAAIFMCIYCTMLHNSLQFTAAIGSYTVYLCFILINSSYTVYCNKISLCIYNKPTLLINVSTTTYNQVRPLLKSVLRQLLSVLPLSPCNILTPSGHYTTALSLIPPTPEEFLSAKSAMLGCTDYQHREGLGMLVS